MGDAMGVSQNQPLIKLFIIYGNRPAFPGSDGFYRVKRKTRHISQTPHRFPVILRPYGMSCVLNEDKIMFITDLPDLFHLHSLTSKIYRNDSLCSLCNTLLYAFGINIVSFRVHIRKYRSCPAIQDAVRAGRKRKRRRDHFIPRPYPGSHTGTV